MTTEPLAGAAAAWLAARADVRECRSSSAKFADCIAPARGLIVRTDTVVDRALLERAPALRVVGRAGVGLDNVDLAACRARGVQVVYRPGANTQAVVEYVLGLVLERLRPRKRLTRALAPAGWRRLRADLLGPVQIDELTIGILGLGRIGGRLAAAVAALGAGIIYHDLIDVPASGRHGAVPVSAEELFAGSDVLSIHVDDRPGNRHFVSAHLIGHLRPGVCLVNTSRGLVVDSQALARFLEANPGASAILDVHEEEPFPATYPLLGLPNAWLYPHLAGRTRTSLERMCWVVRDVMAVIEGGAAEFPAPQR